MFASAQLLDQLALAHRIGIEEGAFVDRDVQKGAILRKAQPSDGLTPIGCVQEVFLRDAEGTAVVAPSCSSYHDATASIVGLELHGHNVDLTGLLRVLERQGQLRAVLADVGGHLALALTRLDLAQRELGHNFVAREALSEVEKLDRLSEDNHDPVTESACHGGEV